MTSTGVGIPPSDPETGSVRAGPAAREALGSSASANPLGDAEMAACLPSRASRNHHGTPHTPTGRTRQGGLVDRKDHEVEPGGGAEALQQRTEGVGEVDVDIAACVAVRETTGAYSPRAMARSPTDGVCNSGGRGCHRGPGFRRLV